MPCAPRARLYQDSAAFTAECVTVDPSRAEHVQQVLSAGRATLARSRAEEFQFRSRPADVPGAPVRSRDRPLAPRDRTAAAPASAPQPDTQVPTWADERTAVFDAIRGLRELCEIFSEKLADLRWRQLSTQFDNPNTAYREMNQWVNEERARIEAARGSRDDEGKEEPLEIPSLRSLRLAPWQSGTERWRSRR